MGLAGLEFAHLLVKFTDLIRCVLPRRRKVVQTAAQQRDNEQGDENQRANLERSVATMRGSATAGSVRMGNGSGHSVRLPTLFIQKYPNRYPWRF